MPTIFEIEVAKMDERNDVMDEVMIESTDRGEYDTRLEVED